MSLHFEDVVAAALENRLPDTIYLAAVSGGADSTAMLAALVAVREQGQGFELRCLHVEHGIRRQEESRGDAEFVRSFCEKYRVPCCVVSVKPGKVAETAKKRGLGIEAAARLYRHRAWFREAARLEADGRGSVRVLVAHTADDMLETVLMRVLRGAGPSGLAAMPASRGRILRPLLALTRQDVLAYLTQKNIPWCEDSTNTDTRYLRNRVRHRLVPLLADDFPHWRKALSSLAETQSLAADFIVNEATLRVKWRPLPEMPETSGLLGGFCRKADTVLGTDEENFFAQPAIVREEALFQGIDVLMSGSGSHQALAHEVKRSNIRRFSEGKVSAADLGRVHLRRKGGTITISRRKKVPGEVSCSEYGFSLLINTLGFYTLKGITLEVCEGMSAADTGEAVFFARLPFVLRPSFKEDRTGRAGNGAKALCAVDSLGIAAFIGTDGLLERRCGKPYGNGTLQAANENLCAVKVGTERSIGGINVQRSKRRSV